MAYVVTDRITGGEKSTAWILLAIAIAANAAGYFLGWFGQFPWYDDLLHGYTTFALSLVIGLHLYGRSLSGAATHGISLVLTIAAIGVALGALWEVGEWAYDQWLAQGNVIMQKRDTILDLVWDTVGALVAGVVAVVMARN